MPVFSIPTKDGRIIDVTTPEGATLQDAENYLRSQMRSGQMSSARQAQLAALRSVPDYALPEEEIGLGTNLFGGFSNGIVGLFEQAAYGAASLLDKEAELAARENIGSVADALSVDVDEDSAVAQVAGGIGSIAGALPLAVFGGVPALVGGAALFGAAGAGEQATRAIAAGATEEEKSTAEIKGALVGLLDILPIGRVSKAFKVKAVSDLVDKLGPREVSGFLNRVRNASVTGGVEGVQEGFSGLLQNAIEQEYNPEAELLGGLAGQAGVGVGAGATIQILADLVRGKRTPSSAGVEEGAPEATEEETLLLTDKTVPVERRIPPMPEFVPVVAPDGSVFTSRVEQDEYLLKREAEARAAAKEQASIADPTMSPELRKQVEDDYVVKSMEQLRNEMTPIIEQGEQERRVASGDMFPEELEQAQVFEPIRQVGATRQPTAIPEQTAQQPAPVQGDLFKDADDRELAALIAEEEAQKAQVDEARIEAQTQQIDTDRQVAQETSRNNARRQVLEAQIPVPAVAQTEQPTLPSIEGRKRAAKKYGPVPEQVAPEPVDVPAQGQVQTEMFPKSPRWVPVGKDTKKLYNAALDRTMNKEGDKWNTYDAQGSVVYSNPTKSNAVAANKVDLSKLTEKQVPVSTTTRSVGSKSKLAEPKKAEPVQAKKAEPKKAEPVQAKKAEPKKAEPVQAKKPEPKKAKPKKTEPVQAKKAEPVQAKKGDPVAGDDLAKITEVMGAESPSKGESGAAKDYFSGRKKDINSALRDIAIEVADPVMAKAGKGIRKAKLAKAWVESNLSDRANTRLRRFIAVEAGYTEKLEDGGLGPEYLTKTMSGYEVFVPRPELIKHLEDGNLAAALSSARVSMSGHPQMIKIARALSKNIEDVKLDYVADLRHKVTGKPVMGYYDAATNTVTINSDADLQDAVIHTLLHETGHAALSASLKKKGLPTTRRLTALFDKVKSNFPDEYASENVSEFASEVIGNVNFRQRLAQIQFTDNGTKKNALTEVMAAITRFFRNLFGMQDFSGNALKNADELILNLMTPAGQNPNAGIMYLAGASGKSKQLLQDITSKIPTYGKDQLERIRILLDRKGLPNTAKRGVSAVLPLNVFADYADSVTPLVRELDKLTQLKSGYVGEKLKSLKAVTSNVAKWAHKNKEASQALNNMIYKSTYMQIDPTRPASYYKDKVDKSGNDLSKDHAELVKEFNQLTPEAKQFYKQMRDQYREFFLEIREVLNTRLKASDIDPKVRSKVIDKLYDKLTSGAGIDPYFPLTRKGNFWLTYTADNEQYKETFESKTERKLAVAQLRSMGSRVSNINEYEQQPNGTFGKGSNPAFMSEVLNVLKKNKVEDEVTEDVLKLFLDAIPENSFLQSFRARSGVRGFEGDNTFSRIDSNGDAKFNALDALQSKGASLVHQLSNMKYGAEIGKIESQAREDLKTLSGKASVSNEEKSKLTFVTEELLRRSEFAKSPNVPKWAQWATSLGFGMTLGMNASSAVLNLFQIPTIGAPILAGLYGTKGSAIKAYKEAYGAYTDAAKLIAGSGFSQQVSVVSGNRDKDGNLIYTRQKTSEVMGIDNYDFTDPNLPKHIKQLEPLVRHAQAMGQLNRTITQDLLDVDNVSGPLEMLNKITGGMFHHSERLTRQATLVAAYNMRLDQIKRDKSGRLTRADLNDAAKSAVAAVEEVNGSVASGAAPPIAQYGLGRVAFMFKRYGVQMNALIIKNLFNSFKGTPENKAVARQTAAGIFASTGLLAGVLGMPVIGAMLAIVDMFLDEDDPDAETLALQMLGGGIGRGVLNATFGVDIASRISMSDLIFRMPRINRDQNPVLTAIEYIGGPVLGVSMGVARGAQLAFNEGQWQRGVEQMAPAALRNLLKAGRYIGDEGALTMRGDPIIEDINPLHIFGQMLGFAPAEYVETQQRNSVAKRIDKSVGEQRHKLLRKMYLAYRFNDVDGMREAYEDIAAFNRKHGQGKVFVGRDTIERSIKRNIESSKQMVGGVLPSSARRDPFMDLYTSY